MTGSSTKISTNPSMNTSSSLSTNPLLGTWDNYEELPPFQSIKAEHFKPAFDYAMQEQRVEVERLTSNSLPPTFENTVAALDRCGERFNRIESLFSNLLGSLSSDSLRAIELELAPVLAAFNTEIFGNTALFARIESIVKDPVQRKALTEEQNELLMRFHTDFVRSGAQLEGEKKRRFGEIRKQLAELTARFSQNVLAHESNFALELQAADLDGLPPSLIEAAAQAAKERKSKSPYVITLSRSLVTPFLSFSTRRDLRKKIFEAWTRRGETLAEHNNLPIIKQILTLRKELAQLLGYQNFADYAMADRMAATPAAAKNLVLQAWEPAKKKAAQELAQMAAIARREGMNEALEAWDWRFYAEKVRAEMYALSDQELKPYFTLGNMTQALFDTAQRLFGLRFKPVENAKLYHPDARLYEVTEHNGAKIGFFLADNFARTDKQGGAWMSLYRMQTRNTQSGVSRYPIISNNNNFARAADPDKSLLSLDDVRTLFHEFGHGLHGLLSNTNYGRLSGTNVLQDFVELPSQLFEHWGTNPQQLRKFARHYQTDVPIPEHLIEKIQAASTFNMGFETVEYCACCLVDLELHQVDEPANLDINRFERETLEKIGMPREIVMRHRLPHFHHLFSGENYAAGYYVYLWAEVLDADAFEAFLEAGDVFDHSTATSLRKHVYGAGASVAPMKTYKAFRGRAPKVEPMLKDRGLL